MKAAESSLRINLFNKKQFLSVFFFWFPLLTSVGFFYHLQDKPLWSDEIQTWHTVSRLNWADFFSSLTAEHAHPPLYFFIMWVIGIFVDWTEYTLRFFSALCALAANVSLFVFFKKKISSIFAICFSIAFGFSYSVRYFSQEARPYALLIFLSCISFIFFIQLLEDLIEDKDKSSYFFKWLITLFFLMSSHYYGLVLAFSEGAIFLFFSIKRKKTYFLKTFLWFFLLVILVLSFFILKDLRLEKLIFLDKLDILNFLKEIFSELGNILIFEQYQWLMFSLLIINYVFYVKKFKIQLTVEKKNIIFILISLTGIFFVFFISLYLVSLFRPIYTFRYLYFLNPIFLYVFLSVIYFLVDILLYFFSTSALQSFMTRSLFLGITVFLTLEMFKINLGQIDYNRLLTKTNLRQISDKYNRFKFLYSSSEKVFIESVKTHELEFYVYRMGLDAQSWVDLAASKNEKEFEFEQILNVQKPDSFLYFFYSEKELITNQTNMADRVNFLNNLNYKEIVLTKDENSTLVRFVSQKK